MTSKLGSSSPPTKPSHDPVHYDTEDGNVHQYRHAPAEPTTTSSTPIITVQPPRREDLQPSYAQTLVAPDDPGSHGWYGSMMNVLGEVVGFFGSIPGCIFCPNPFKSIEQGSVGLVTKWGRLERAVDPGLVKINPLSEELRRVDVKIQIVEVPQQTCMTKDNVSLVLTSVIYYHITSPHKAIFGISDIRVALAERTQTTLRHVVGARVLQDVIERREEVAQSIAEIIEGVAAGWGVAVESMLIKDIVFSDELQASLSMAATSKRIGESKVIAARAEVESAKLMRQAADILSSAPAMQIRYLEAMQAMAKSANSKVIFLPGPAGSQAVQQSHASDSDTLVEPGEGSGTGAGGAGAGAGAGNAGYSGGSAAAEYGVGDEGLQRAINAHIVQSM